MDIDDDDDDDKNNDGMDDPYNDKIKATSPLRSCIS